VTAVTLSDSSVVGLHPLHIGEERDGETEVGRPETGVFVSLPAEGVALVRWLQAETPLSEVAERFAAAYGIEPVLDDFVRELSGCGFVRSIDGRPLAEPDEPEMEEPRGWRLLAGLPQSRVAWLLTRPARLCYAAIWLALAAVLVTRPDVWPSADRAFLDIGDLGNLFVLTGLGWLLVFLHEVAHLVAVRARGCSGTLDVSHRLHLLVAQTDMTSVRVLPHRERYAPYLAGMTWDATLLLVCLLLQWAAVPSGLPGVIAFLLAGSLLFQFAIFLRTDVYYVATNVLRLANLMHDTRRWLANTAARALGAAPRHDLSDVPPRELRVIRWFALVAVLGVGLTIGEFLALGLPLLLAFVRDAGSGLGAGVDTVTFWDSVGLLAIVGAQFGVLLVAVDRERRRRRARRARTAAGLALIDEVA
jgi:putative peptide zinc metalloprotease protein